MPSNGGNITFGIDFNVNKSGLNDLKKSLQDVQKMTTKDLVGNLGSSQAKKALEEAKRSAAEVEQALKKAYNPTLGTTNITKFNQELKNSGTNLNQVYQRFSKLGTTGQTAFTNLASNILTTNVKLKQTSSLLDSMGKTMINTVKWGIASSVMNTFTGSVQNAFNYVKALDSSLTDIRIVTGDSRDQMDRFAKSANQAAQALGRQTKEYTNAALTFYQQGLSDEEVAARTETTLKASNITGADVTSMANQLTAVWNGFQVAGQNTNEVVSKLAAVADSSASNMSELATAMSKSASIANNMGVSIDQLGAQISTIIATTRQAPQTVGNALKTIYARINDIKAGTDQAQISLGNYTGKMAKLGISVLDQNGQLRDTGQVMEQIGQRWGDMTKQQQVYLAQTMAGQRQMNNLIALFDNWDTYSKQLNISLEAQGTLDQKNARYMESLAAHTREFQAAQEGLIQSFADADSFKGFIDLGTEAVKIITSLIDSIGGGGNAILALGSIFTSVFSGVISKEINSLVTNFQNAKFNAEQLNQVIANTKSVAAIEGISDNKAVQAMIDAQTETQKYYSVMSEAQINHQNDLIKELGLAEQNRANWEKNTEAAQKYAKVISGNDNIDILKQESQGWDELGYHIQHVEEYLLATEAALKEVRGESSSENVETLVANMKELLDTQDQTTESAKRLSKAIAEIESSSELSDSAITELKAASQSFINETKNSLNNLSTVYNDGGQAVATYSNQIDNLNTVIKTNNETAKQAFDTQNIVSAIGAIGQLTSAWMNLTRLPTIWSDQNLSAAQKFKQSITNIAMSLPMLITGYQKLNSVLKINQTLEALWITLSKKRKDTAIEEAAINALLEKNQIKINGQRVLSAGLLSKEQKQYLLLFFSKNSDVAATEAQTAANLAYQASLGVIMIALAAVAAVTIGVAQHMERVRQSTIDTNKAIIEQTKASQQQVDANGQLYKSFSQLKSQYDQGLITKEELYDATTNLADAYGIQGAAIANLTGQYDEFAAAAKNAREEQLKTQIQANRNQITSSTQNMVQEGRKGSGKKVGNNYYYTPKSGFFDPDQAYQIYGKATGTNLFGDISESTLSVDYSDPQSIIEYYEKLQNAISQLNKAGYTGTKLYQDVQNEVTQMTEAYNSAIEAYTANEKNLLQLSASQSGIAEASSQVDFEKSIETFRQRLTEAAQEGLIRSDTDIDKLINQYISGLHNDFANQYLASKTVEQAENITSEVKDAFEKLPEEQKTILLTAGFDLSKVDTKNQLDAVVAELTAKKGYIEIPVQLINNVKESLFEGKDISEKDFEGLQESFSPEIGAQLGDVDSFNNKTLREQLDLLKQVTQAQYEKNEAVLASIETQRELGELANQDLEKERSELSKTIQKVKQTRDTLKNMPGTSEAIAGLDQQIKALQDQLQALLEEDYSIDIEVNADDNVLAKFNSEISDIVDNTVLLEKAASLIGEGFQVAASDIGALTSIFPEITDNAVTTADGIVQLDQAVVEQVLGGNSQILQSESQVARQRIQHKVDMLDAEIAYCDRRLAILQQVLDGQISEAQASELLQQEKGQFAEDMANASGQAWVSAQEQGASSNAANTNVVIGNLDLIGQTANQVAAAVKAAMAGQEANYQGAGRKASGAAGTSFSDSQIAKYAGKNGTSMGQAADRMAKIQQQIKQIQAEKTSAEKLKNQYIEQMAKMAESTTKAVQKAGNAAAGLGGNYDASKGGGGGGGGGGGKDKTKSAEEIDKLKLKDQDVDKYHQIERAIKRIDDYLDEMSGYEEKTIRQGKSDTIDKEVDALEQQKALYEQKIQMMQADLQLQQADLALLGVQFDEQGNIINYTALMSAYQAQYNALLEQAKLLTGDAQQNKLQQASNLKQQLESLKSQMGAYEALQDKIVDAGAAIRDIIDKEEELRIKQFKIKIDTELEFADAKRDWNEFKKEVIDKIKDDDFLGQARARVQDFFSYYDDQGNGIIQQLTEHVNRTREQAEIIENGGTSSIYGKNEAQAIEDLKHYTDELMQNLKDVQEIAKDIHDLYLDTIDKAQDAFDEQIDQYEQIDGIIEHDMNLLQLLSPQNNEEQLAHYYDQRAKNHNQEIDFYRREADMWKAQMENAEQGTEEWKKFRDNWESSINDLNSAVESAVENLLDKYQNTISKIIKDTKNQIMGGDWQKAMDEWDRAKWQDDRYLDMGSRATGVLDFMDKVNEAMNGQSPKVQKQLNEFLKKQVDYLNEIPNLRQVDLDIAYKKLEVLQKQMALEDAQEAKTRMRLRRDSQGNYTYQYVADEDDIANKQQQLRDTLEELRQLAKVDISDTMDEVQEKLDEFFEHAQELSQTYYDDQDLLQQKLLELQNEYFGEEGYITLLTNDYHNMQEQLLIATGAQFETLLNQQNEKLKQFLGLTETDTNATQAKIWESILALMSPDGGQIPTLFEAFTTDVFKKNLALMSEENQKLLFGPETGLDPTWYTALGNMAANYTSLTRDIVLPCMQAMVNANGVYMQDLANLQQVAGVVFSDVAAGLDADIAYTQGLIQANDYLVDTMNAQVNAIAAVNAQIANLCSQYAAAEQAAINAANAALKFWFAANGQTIGDYYSSSGFGGAAAPASAPVSGGTTTTGGGGGGGGGSKGRGSGVSAGSGQYFMVKGAGGEATFYEYKGDGNFNASTSKQVDASVAMNGSIVDRNAYAAGNYSQVGGMSSSIYQRPQNSKGSGDTSGPKVYDPYKKRMSGVQKYATGGYTGEWANGSEDGRLAVLHQKELVLNPEDTVNMLNAVKIASGMMQHVFGVNGSLLDRLNSNGSIGNIANANSTDASMSQNIVINADFPNANNAEEIRQAFNNLINIASQRASGNRRTY